MTILFSSLLQELIGYDNPLIHSQFKNDLFKTPSNSNQNASSSFLPSTLNSYNSGPLRIPNLSSSPITGGGGGGGGSSENIAANGIMNNLKAGGIATIANLNELKIVKKTARDVPLVGEGGKKVS